jgi:hypothetical protein
VQIRVSGLGVRLPGGCYSLPAIEGGHAVVGRPDGGGRRPCVRWMRPSRSEACEGGVFHGSCRRGRQEGLEVEEGVGGRAGVCECVIFFLNTIEKELRKYFL